MPYIPQDEPYYNDLWHLHGEFGINVEGAWENYSGRGVKIGFTEKGYDTNNRDISDNLVEAYDHTDGDADVRTEADHTQHGTYTTSFATGAANGMGTVGVAYEGDLYAYKSNSTGVTGALGAFRSGLENADVFNNSWHFPGSYSDNHTAFLWRDVYGDDLDKALVEGRGGLGVNVIFSAGNERIRGDSSNTHNLQNDIGTIAVGATEEDGTYAFFSSEGANLLLTAPGRQVFAANKEGGIEPVDGTSFSAPQVAGAVALMLEANPDLGWRDTQEILAITSRKLDPMGALEAGDTIGGSGNHWRVNGGEHWNGAGMAFNNDYGYGMLDVTAATNLAATWDKQSTSQNMIEKSASLSFDEGAQPVSVIEFEMAENISVDQISLALDWSSTLKDTTEITLISPSGTRSTIINGIDHDKERLDFTYTSNAFWGEESQGTWKLEFSHEESDELLPTRVHSIDLTVHGDETTVDDTHFITSDLGRMIEEGFSDGLVVDTDGGMDTLNVSATSEGVRIALAGGMSLFEGTEFRMFGATIENVISGRGNDRLFGTNGDNLITSNEGEDDIFAFNGNDEIVAGDGNDRVSGGGGDDTIRTGAGNDLVDGGLGADIIFSEGGDDVVIAGLDDDQVDAGGGSDRIWAGDGNDHVLGNTGDDHIDGGAGDDYLSGGYGTDYLRGADGDDLISGGAERDRLYGDEGNDRLYGDTGNDVISGGEGNDSIDGGAGRDILFGNSGDDRLDGGSGGDHMYGGFGNDVYVIDHADDEAREAPEEGLDLALYTERGIFQSGDNIEYGRLLETAQDASLEMSDDDNRIWGNSFDNTLRGGAGDDHISGGGGADQLWGGSGADRFIADFWDQVAFQVMDFETGIDKIDISRLFWGSNATDPFAEGLITINQDREDVRVGFNGGESFEVCTLMGQSAENISQADFIF